MRFKSLYQFRALPYNPHSARPEAHFNGLHIDSVGKTSENGHGVLIVNPLFFFLISFDFIDYICISPFEFTSFPNGQESGSKPQYIII